jgi:hypothetical protein
VGNDDSWLLYTCAVANPGAPPAPGCAAADLDENGTVDDADHAAFVPLFGREPSPHEAITDATAPCGLGFGLAWIVVPLFVVAQRRSLRARR